MTSKIERLQRRYLAQKLIAMCVSIFVVGFMGMGFLMGTDARRRAALGPTQLTEINAKKPPLSLPGDDAYVRVTNLTWGSKYYSEQRKFSDPDSVTNVWLIGYADVEPGGAPGPHPAFLVRLNKASYKSDVRRVLEKPEFVGYVDSIKFSSSADKNAKNELRAAYPELDVDGALLIVDDTPGGDAFLAGVSTTVVFAGCVVLIGMACLFANGYLAGRRVRRGPPPLPRTRDRRKDVI